MKFVFNNIETANMPPQILINVSRNEDTLTILFFNGRCVLRKCDTEDIDEWLEIVLEEIELYYGSKISDYELGIHHGSSDLFDLPVEAAYEVLKEYSPIWQRVRETDSKESMLLILGREEAEGLLNAVSDGVDLDTFKHQYKDRFNN